jgi:uncharacterized protein (DUF1810 family)
MIAETTPADPFDLQRFVSAQNPVLEQVRTELQAGRKRSHWMWFVFPQLQGLGSSPTAMRYAIRSLEEARAYLQHPLLGPRLRDCTSWVNAVEGRSVAQIFGYPDDLKFHSSMTLFARVSGDDSPFGAALRKYFMGERDRGTLELLSSGSSSRAWRPVP